MVLIGLIGPKESGKDTLADYLVSHYRFQKHAFADPIKQICRIMFLLDPEQLNDHTLKETIDKKWGLTPRQMMQKLGTDVIRNIWDNDFWLKHIDFRLDFNNDIVISDVRFPNEAQWIKDRGGILVRIDDGRINNSSKDDTHESETSNADIQEDFCVFNNKKNLLEFHQEIKHILTTILS